MKSRFLMGGGGTLETKIAPHRREKEIEMRVWGLSPGMGGGEWGAYTSFSLSSEAFLSGKYRSLEKHG